jgi:4-hydroxy-tetrahydrodipicolinate reductase
MKVDAPSGTALLLGEAAARGREVGLSNVAVRGRDGITGARESGTIGFAALRGGSVAEITRSTSSPITNVCRSAILPKIAALCTRAVKGALWLVGSLRAVWDAGSFGALI